MATYCFQNSDNIEEHKPTSQNFASVSSNDGGAVTNRDLFSLILIKAEE